MVAQILKDHSASESSLRQAASQLPQVALHWASTMIPCSHAVRESHPEGLKAARVSQQRGAVAAQRAPLVFERREGVAPQQADGGAVGYLPGPRAVPDVLQGA